MAATPVVSVAHESGVASWGTFAGDVPQTCRTSQPWKAARPHESPQMRLAQLPTTRQTRHTLLRHPHTHTYERQRGSSTARGYDAAHRHLRRAWEARLATGETHTCAKCGQPVTATDQWDLGHTDNRQSWTGPEHRSCNRKDGQHKATASIEHWTRHQAKPQQQPQSQPTGKPQTQTRHDTTQTNQTQADKPNKHTQQKQQNTRQNRKKYDQPTRQRP